MFRTISFTWELTGTLAIDRSSGSKASFKGSPGSSTKRLAHSTLASLDGISHSAKRLRQETGPGEYGREVSNKDGEGKSMLANGGSILRGGPELRDARRPVRGLESEESDESDETDGTETERSSFDEELENDREGEQEDLVAIPEAEVPQDDGEPQATIYRPLRHRSSLPVYNLRELSGTSKVGRKITGQLMGSVHGSEEVQAAEDGAAEMPPYDELKPLTMCGNRPYKVWSGIFSKWFSLN